MDVGPQRHQPSGHLAERFVDVNGVRRIYRVASGDNARTRLVVVLHGARGTGLGMAGLTRLAERGPAGAFTVAFPDGVGGVWNDNRGKYNRPRR